MLIERNKSELYLHILKTRDDFDNLDILNKFVKVASTKDFINIFKSKNYKIIISEMLPVEKFKEIEENIKVYKKENKERNKEKRERKQYNQDMMLILHLYQQYPLEVKKFYQN